MCLAPHVHKNLVPAVAARVVDDVNPHPPILEVLGKNLAPFSNQALASVVPNLAIVKLDGNLAVAEKRHRCWLSINLVKLRAGHGLNLGDNAHVLIVGSLLDRSLYCD